MKKLQDQVKAVTKELAKLTKKVEKLQQQVAKAAAAPKKPAAKKTAKKAAPKKKKAAPAKTPGDKKPTVLEAVYDVVRRARNGATIAKLKEKTGLTPRQLSNALYKLSTRGMIEAKARGVYVKKK